MMELFKEYYYYLDLLAGYLSPVVLFLMLRSGRIDSFMWRVFWLGAFLGTLWEAPIFILSGEATALPIIIWHNPLPAHYVVFLICHSLWDGLLFVIGARLVMVLCRGPHFQSFRFRELAVLLLWGQASALLVELSSTMNDGWSYIEYPWNPVLFLFNGHNITTLIQFVWAAAPILFYLTAIRIKANAEFNTKNQKKQT
ncbi:MAG TPA: hypothetical protein PKH33_02090 [bacterium]|nr:hypothetical protein [bacterium]